MYVHMQHRHRPGSPQSFGKKAAPPGRVYVPRRLERAPVKRIPTNRESEVIVA